jgi:hypothetical protein
MDRNSSKNSEESKQQKEAVSASVEKIKDVIPAQSEDSSAQLHPNFVQAREATQFKPGQSGNPAGRPRKQGMIGDMINELGNQPLASPAGALTRWHCLILGLFNHGTKGDAPAARELFDRAEGKVRFAMSSDGNGYLDELVAALKAGPIKYSPARQEQNAKPKNEVESDKEEEMEKQETEDDE